MASELRELTEEEKWRFWKSPAAIMEIGGKKFAVPNLSDLRITPEGEMARRRVAATQEPMF
ncbi:MAG: hypothetical protein WC495_03105 [Patescibacteria group bacterium]